jgi:hypothetical protein
VTLTNFYPFSRPQRRRARPTDGAPRSCRRTDATSPPSTLSSATVRTLTFCRPSRRVDCGRIRRFACISLTVCSCRGRTDPPNSSRPTPACPCRNTSFLFSSPFWKETRSIVCTGVVQSHSPDWNFSENALHHRQMFPVVVRLEKGYAQVQFEQDATDGPHVARLRPS